MIAIEPAPTASTAGPAPGATVVEADSLRRFAELPRELYRGDSRWIPPLLADEVQFLGRRNPYVRNNPTRLFMALRGGRPVGRVAATVCRRHNECHGERTGFFGFFECEPETTTADRLLAAAAGFVRGHGMDTLRGPFSFTTNHRCGLLVEGFDSPPLVDMSYNPPWYEGLLREIGFLPVKDLLAYWSDLDHGLPREDFMDEVARRPGAGRFTVRPLRTRGRGLREDMAFFSDLYRTTWKDNWGFVPLDPDELDYLLERLRPVLDSRIAYVGLDGERPVGTFIGIPDFNQVLRVLDGRLWPWGVFKAVRARRRIDAGRIFLGGVYDEYRSTPLALMLFRRCLLGARALGYRGMESSWILEDNVAANRFLRRLDLQVYKRYRIYEKAL